MNTLGTLISLTLFGESHGPYIGVVIDGLAPGIVVDETQITRMLSLRRPCTQIDTARVEEDKYQIISGVYNGYTTGSPLTIIIPNENIRPNDYSSNLARPSHIDYAANIKYRGFQDKNGGGHFSGRLTAAIVASGAICLQALENKGIKIGTHILTCGSVCDESFASVCENGVYDDSELRAQIDLLYQKIVPVVSDIEAEINEEIATARNDGDSVGGILQTAIVGLPAGVGEPCFDSLEAAIAKAVFAIGGVKGIEFGSGFELAKMRGSEANDAFRSEGGRVYTSSNHSGGVNGGISNAMPVLFQTVVRPTPSIAKVQHTIDLETRENALISVYGRHDPAIVRRVCIVITSIVALVLCDMLAQAYGRDWLAADKKG